MSAVIVFISYQVQFKQNSRDRDWTVWETTKDLKHAERMVTQFEKMRCSVRLLQLRTEVTTLAEVR